MVACKFILFPKRFVQVASRRSTEASAAGTSSSLSTGTLALLVPRASHIHHSHVATAGRASSSVSLGSGRPSSAASGSVVAPLPSGGTFAWSAQEQLVARDDSWRNQAAGSDPGGRLQVSSSDL
jgi:hypothetical protein